MHTAERALAWGLLVALNGGCGTPVESANEGASGTTVATAEADVSVPPVSTAPPPRPSIFTHTLTSGIIPASVVVSGGTVYFAGMTSGTTSGTDSQFGIWSVPSSGGARTLFHATGVGSGPNSLVVAHGSLYWQEAAIDPGTWTKSLSGGAARKLVSIPSLVVMQKQGVAVRATALTLLGAPVTSITVVSSDPDNNLLSKESRVYPISGFSTTALVARDAMDSEGFYYPDSVTMDASNAYFVAFRDSEGPNTVYQVSLGGGKPLAIGAADYASPIALHGNQVYFVRGNAIVTIPVGGGTQSTFATDSGRPTTFAVDGSTLYWTCTTCGTVSKHSFTGGSTTTLAGGEQSPQFLDVDSTNVYWGAHTGVRYHAK